MQLSASLGALTLQTTRPSNRDLSGPCVSLEAGHGVWLGRQWSLGAAARITVADLRGVPGSTLLFMPGVFATIAWH